MAIDLPHGVDDSVGEKVANGGFPPLWGKRPNFEHVVHGHGDHSSVMLDQHERTVGTRWPAREARDEVDDGDDGAPDVDETAHPGWRTGQARSGTWRKDLPHDVQLDPTDSFRQPKEDQLAGRNVR